MKFASIVFPDDELRAFCERHAIRRLSLFGSVLRDDFRPDSDIDVLVEFEPGHTPGWDIVAMQDELTSMLGRIVDFRTPEELHPRFRWKVLSSARVLYERAG